MTEQDTDTTEDRVESLLEQQAETIERQQQVIEEQRETIDTLEARLDGESGGDLSVSRRRALKTGGLLALLAGGVGTASADAQGQVGTDSDPLQALYTEELNGGVVGDQAVTNLVGNGLIVSGGTLSVDLTAPDDLDALLDGMDGDGSSGSPYQITNVSELQAMDADTEAHYELANDIEASLTALWNDGDGFTPLGDFAGTFDGKGHTITRLAINRSDENYVGLFGRLSGTIQNVGLKNINITGSDYVGGLVGWNEASDITSSSATGSVSGDTNVGGLVGWNEGTVKQSYATGNVTGSESVGGLVGLNSKPTLSSLIEQSYAHVTGSASVSGTSSVGGLVGDNNDDVEKSYATCNVSGDTNVGGLVGNNDETVDSYWNSDLKSTGNGGGGFFNATGLTTSEMQGGEADDNMGDLEFSSVWATVDAENDDESADDYPVLQALDRAAQLEARE